MGRREFYAWVDQRNREIAAQRGAPDRWGGDDDQWWEQARARRARMQGRA